MPSNPAHSVRGPRHSVKKGATPVLSSEEATALLTGMDVSTVVGLRDRAIITVMRYTFARVGAVVALEVEDYFPQKKRRWLRLHEKNGKLNEIPCHHKLEEYLGAYIKARTKTALSFRSAYWFRDGAKCFLSPKIAWAYPYGSPEHGLPSHRAGHKHHAFHPRIDPTRLTFRCTRPPSCFGGAGGYLLYLNLYPEDIEQWNRG